MIKAFITVNSFPKTIKLFFLGALILNISRSATLPYIVFYLNKSFELDTAQIGLIIGISLIVGTTMSSLSGTIVDRSSNTTLLNLCILVFSIAFFILGNTLSTLVFFIALTCVHFSYSLLDVVIKVGFAKHLLLERRITAFSIKYTLTNVGFALGPFIGLFIVKKGGLSPFIFSGALALLFLVLWHLAYDRPPTLSISAVHRKPPRLNDAIKVMLEDKKLIWFIFGGFFSTIIFGQFIPYLSQYLFLKLNAEKAYQIISGIVTTNALIVIIFQYGLSQMLGKGKLIYWFFLGLALLFFGLVGFGLFLSISAWILFMVLFSLGELIVVPCEYLFIDRIAPENMRGSYYGAQQFSGIGAAFGPIICGLVISGFGTSYMFPVLCFFLLISVGFYYVGIVDYGCERRTGRLLP